MKAVRRVLATLSLIFFFAVPAKATTYYVSPSGSDTNSCATAQSATQSNQKQTISAGVACLSAGDTLYIHGGTYAGSANAIRSASTTVSGGTNFSTGAITIAAYPSEAVTIQPPQGVGAIALTNSTQQYLIFQDLIIDMINQSTPISDPDGIYLSSGASHIRFQRLEVKNNASSGLHFSSSGGASGYNEVLHCSIHDNGRTDLAGNGGYGIYLSTSNNLIEGNDFYANNGYGVHLNPLPGEGNNNIIRQNRIHGNFVHGTIGGGGSTSYGVVVARGDNNLVYDNLIYANQGGILVYTDSTATQLYNNTITGNLGHGGGGESGIDLQYYASAPTIENNIIYNNANAPMKDYGGSGSPTFGHNLTTDPSFNDAGANDYTLQSRSAARDAGTTIAVVPFDYDGVPRPLGGAYDIGAYEYGTGTPPTPPVHVRLVP